MSGATRAAPLALALVCGVVAIASAQARPAVTKCPPVKAGGQTYSVSTTKVTCSLADTWVTRLAGKRIAPHSSQVKLVGGPRGFRCVGGTKSAGADMPGIAANVDIAGNCAKGLGVLGGGPYFNWVVRRNPG